MQNAEDVVDFTVFVSGKLHAQAHAREDEELGAQKKRTREAKAAEAEVRSAAKPQMRGCGHPQVAAATVAALKASKRQLRALGIREQKEREKHAKILVGVAMFHQCQIRRGRGPSSRAMLEEVLFRFAGAAQDALYGLSLVVKKPSSDLEQD